jgi:hypothetical protein
MTDGTAPRLSVIGLGNVAIAAQLARETGQPGTLDRG